MRPFAVGTILFVRTPVCAPICKLRNARNGGTVSGSRPVISLFVNLVVDNFSSHQLPHNPGSQHSRASAELCTVLPNAFWIGSNTCRRFRASVDISTKTSATFTRTQVVRTITLSSSMPSQFGGLRKIWHCECTDGIGKTWRHNILFRQPHRQTRMTFNRR
jgi:hypothetical protein